MVSIRQARFQCTDSGEGTVRTRGRGVILRTPGRRDSPLFPLGRVLAICLSPTDCIGEGLHHPPSATQIRFCRTCRLGSTMWFADTCCDRNRVRCAPPARAAIAATGSCGGSWEASAALRRCMMPMNLTVWLRTGCPRSERSMGSVQPHRNCMMPLNPQERSTYNAQRSTPRSLVCA
jgi:hypothetical protein